MKRSEMLEKIWNKVMSESVPNETTMDQVKRMLKAAEENGMLPPTTELSHLKGLRDNAWDPE